MNPIKFNLIVDKFPVRNLEELKNNFNIDDIFDHFQSGTLQRWLQVRDFQNEFNQVSNLNIRSKSLSNQQIAQNLIEIFLIKSNERDILHFIINKEKNNRLLLIEQQKLKSAQIIDDYHNRYEILKAVLLNEKSNRAVIAEAVEQLSDEFFQLFKLEVKELLQNYFKNNILVLISILLNNKLREFPLKFKDIKLKLTDILIIRDEYIRDIYNDFKSFKGLDNNLSNKIRTFQGDTEQKWLKIENREVLILQSNAGTKLRDNYNSEIEFSHVYAKGIVMHGLQFQSFKENHFVKYLPLEEIDGFVSSIITFRGETGGYWKDLESSKNSCLILKIGNSCFVRSLGKVGEELNSDNINGEFILLNGIDYKSNSETEILYYIKAI